MPSEGWPARGSWEGGQRGQSYTPLLLPEPLLTLLYSIWLNMKVLELLRPQRRRLIGDQIDASEPLQLASAPSLSLAPAPAPAPALCDAQEALQEVETKRRKEDLAVEESVKEVLAWAQVHRPKNTTKAYLPKQREWKVSSPLLQCLLSPFI
jgi:hypothetical protein